MSYEYGVFEGLEKVDEIDTSSGSYEFDLIGVWKGEDGYYLGTDSGCSCPTPWESYTKADLTGPLTREQAVGEVTAIARDSRYVTADEVAAFVSGL